jgi:hypothetical protein
MEPTSPSSGSGVSRKVATVVVLATCALGMLTSACGGPVVSAKPPSPSVAPNPIAAAPPPPGGPVPAQLLGAWFLSPAAVDSLISCPKPIVDGPACLLRLELTATTYSFVGTLPPGPGEVVVNNAEIDFFNASQCQLELPQGVGRYTWTLTAGVLHLTPLNADPCGRSEYLINQSFYRAP